MTSEAIKFLTISYNEFQVEREITEFYRKSGLPKPEIYVFDTIPAAKFAYRLLLTQLSNNSINLTDEHGKIKVTSVDFPKDIKLSILNIIKIIENHYDNFNNGFKGLPEIKIQLLKNIKPELQERVWNNIINSKSNFFEFKPESYMTNIFLEGVLCGIFLKKYCILCKNPKRILEAKPEQLHNTEGFAIEFNNEDGIYFIEGIQFDPELYKKVFINKNITKKEILEIPELDQIKIVIQHFGYENLIKEITIKDILSIKHIEIIRNLLDLCDHEKFVSEITGKEIMKLKNVEKRALLIQFFGYDNLIQELGAKLIDTKDEFSSLDNLPISYELYDFEMEIESRFRRGNSNMRKFRFVKVEDYSTHKKVCLGVPVSEQTNDCISAIAWTFGMTKEEYNPTIQT